MWYGHGRPCRYYRLLSACTLVSESTACISPLLFPYPVGPQAVHIARGVMKILLLVVCAAAVCNATTDGFRELLKNGKSLEPQDAIIVQAEWWWYGHILLWLILLLLRVNRC